MIVTILLAAGGIASAQPEVPEATLTARVHGRVVDAAGQPIANATVAVEGSPDTVTTDAGGYYTIANAPIGASLVVSKDGFGIGLGTVLAGAADDVVLVPEDQVTETIEVEGAPPPTTQGAARLSRTELQRIPGTRNDVMQTLSAMPGVTSYPLPLGSSGVVIRGSSPQDSKVLIDDFEVPSLYHDIGFRSIIPAEAIESLEYVPGGFDVSYGRAASGIVNLTTRAGDDAGTNQGEVSAGEVGFLTQGALGRRGRYMVAFRRSTVDLLLPALLPDDLDLSLTTVPRYYDEQLRFDYRLSTKWNLRVSSVGSDDALELYASKDRNADKRFANRTRFARLTVAARYHDGPWIANLAISGLALQSTFERGLYQHLDVWSPSLTTRGELVRTTERAAGLRDVQWRLGGENVVTRHRLDLALPGDRREGEPVEPDDPMDVSAQFDGVVTTTNLATWTSLAASLDERVRFTAGVRVDHFKRAHESIVQPRGELAIKLAKRVTARLSAGAYSRPPEHQTELLARLGAERSTQVIAGTTYEPVDGARVQGSLYYTDRSRLITRDAMGTLTNAGRGTTYGAELLATIARGPWLGWLAYAYSHSTRIDAPGEAERLFDYDQPHNLNVAASYKIGRWQIGARFRASSGLPMTPVAAGVFDSDANIHYPIYGEVNSDRAPLHHQLDLRFDKAFRWGPVKMSKFLDIQNVYLNDSVVTYVYGFDYTQRAAFRSLPILPTAGLRGEF